MAKKTKLLPVEITLIVDRSGSMESIRKEVIGGINAFYEEQKKQPGDAVVTFVQFDNMYEVVFNIKPLKEVEPLTTETFVPRGMTALNDAIGRTLAGLDKDTKAPQMIMIMTDGEENSSREYTSDSVKKLVEEAKTRGWSVIFMGANIDAFKVGDAYGIGAGNIAQFAANARGATAATMSVSSKISHMRTAYVAGASGQTLNDAGGDMFEMYSKTLDSLDK